jgi:hypothetical protein
MEQDKTRQMAFRYALTTVSMAALVVAGMCFYQARPHPENWHIYVPVVAVTALLVFPLVNFSYLRGAQPRSAPGWRVALALLYVTIAILFFVVRVMDLGSGRKSVAGWLYGGCWLLAAIGQFYRAYRLSLRSDKQEGNPSPAQ